MKRRVVVPEILDRLAFDDPRARRARRDLVRINALMGNLRWIRRTLQGKSETIGVGSRVVEAGAGDGRLAAALAADGWQVTAIDLMPRPVSCPENVEWIQTDVREGLNAVEGDILVANLFWHHFQDEELASLAPSIERFRGVIASEPRRSPYSRWLGMTLVPFVNEVTRHDLFVSVRAGFRHGDLPKQWDLRDDGWQMEEAVTTLAAYRLQAWKRIGEK